MGTQYVNGILLGWSRKVLVVLLQMGCLAGER